MILEEINGTVVATVIRETGGTQQLAVGDYFSDHERSSLTVIGSGSIVVRVDPSCTLEFRGVETAPETPEVIEAVVETAPVVQEVVIEDTIAATEEAPVIINPKAAKA